MLNMWYIKEILGFTRLMHLKDQKSFVKNNGYHFMTVIQYRECEFYETTQIDTYYVVTLIMEYSGFLKLSSREKYREARKRKVYLLILQNEIFIKFSRHNKESVISCTCHIMDCSYSSHKHRVPTLDIFSSVVLFSEQTCTV